MRDPNETLILPPLVVVRAPDLAIFSIERDLVTHEAIGRWVKATRTALVGWRAPSAAEAREAATGLSHDEAAAYAAWCHMRLPTELEWEAAARGAVATTGLSDAGVRGLCQVWEWTTTPMKKGFVVRGGPYRDRLEQGGSVGARSWEDTGGDDVGFRCVIEGEPTQLDRR